MNFPIDYLLKEGALLIVVPAASEWGKKVRGLEGEKRRMELLDRANRICGCKKSYRFSEQK